MKRIATLTALAGLGLSAQGAWAQSASVVDPGFEQPGASATDALEWREFLPSVRRVVGDATSPAALVRNGVASMGCTSAGFQTFAGCDTDIFDNQTFVFNDPAYEYGCGPVLFSYWYAIPASNPLEYRNAGLKLEFKRPNNSIYIGYEALPIASIDAGGVGHTSGAFEQVSLAVWPARFDFQHLYANMGSVYGTVPHRVSLLPFRFGNVPGGMTDDGYIFWDDVDYVQDKTGAVFDEFIVWDDTEVSLRTLDQAGVSEPSIPVFFYGDSTVYTDGDQIGFGCLPSSDEFNAINIIDRVPSTTEYPQTWVDIVANGYVRAVHQNVDGSAGTFGTSVVTGPSFRASGQPLDLIPDMDHADIDMTYNFPNYIDDGMGGMIPDGPPLRSSFTVTGVGEYGTAASLESVRDYSTDPVVGDTTFTVSFTFTANENINLETARTLGNDAFRLLTLSSMFASRAAGEYDASYLEVGATQLVLADSTPRDAHLFGSPVATSVGSTFTLFQDTDASFNPDSPTIEVTIDSLSGVSGTIGAQGYLASSTDPNDDSLSVWLEWVDAPATIPASTVISGSFTIRALPASAPPPLGGCDADLTGDGNTDVFDFGVFVGNFGRNDLTPFTGGDYDGDGDVDVFDFSIFLGDFGCTS